MAALEELGIKNCYHMNSVFANPRDSEMWREAAESKYFGKGPKFGRREWDNLMGQSEVCTSVGRAMLSLVSGKAQDKTGLFEMIIMGFLS